MAGDAQVADQVGDDRHVHDDDRQPRPREAPGQLVDLQRDEGAGDDDREVLGPPSLQPQADPLRHQQGRVDERADAQRCQGAPVDRREPVEDDVDVAILRVEVQPVGPFGRRHPDVGVQETQDPQAHRQQQQPLEQLEDGDEAQDHNPSVPREVVV